MGCGAFVSLYRPALSSTRGGPPRLYAARFPPELLRFRPAMVRGWERIARMRALGSQPPPHPALGGGRPAWRSSPSISGWPKSATARSSLGRWPRPRKRRVGMAVSACIRGHRRIATITKVRRRRVDVSYSIKSGAQRTDTLYASEVVPPSDTPPGAVADADGEHPMVARVGDDELR